MFIHLRNNISGQFALQHYTVPLPYQVIQS